MFAHFDDLPREGPPILPCHLAPHEIGQRLSRDGLTKLLIAQKSVRKGHGYASAILNGESGEPLHFAEGKKKVVYERFHLANWCEMAQESGLAPFQKLALGIN